MIEFLKICLSRAGADAMITPREMLRDYMTVLNILMQNENVSFADIAGTTVTLRTEADEDEDAAPVAPTTAKKADFDPNDIEI